MATYKTPGVYIEEIPVFPASVAGVNTAVPAFIGYVEKADNNGIGISFNTATRITSILEYETIFGKAEGQPFTVDINDNKMVTPTQRTITVTKGTESKFKMYYNIQMYFSNGGGPCYIVPVGLYSGAAVSKTDMLAGLTSVAKVDEPTLLLFPDAPSLSTAGNRKEVYDAALAQCEKLKDRFAIMDVMVTGSPSTDATTFRSDTVGPDNLKYGAAYYPFLNTTLNFSLNLNLLRITSQKENGVDIANSVNIIAFLENVEQTLSKAREALSFVRIAVASNFSTTNVVSIIGVATTSADNAKTKADALVLAIATFYTGSATATGNTKAAGVTAGTAAGDYITAQNSTTAQALIASLEALITSATSTIAIGYSDTKAYNTNLIVGSLSYIKDTNPAVYNTISAQLTNYTLQLNPSGAMAGIYARVDAERGVWKAPANVGVRSITGPSINVTNSEQDGLNVDATSGKSINVIRSFTGRGTLVWGARTLAGNDNEWRYINVRRLFTYVEESVQEATAFVVFEPNTANTWQRVKGMIEAFLTGLWRDGALAGATTKEAYFVRVGLGVTMTAQDILEGRMLVEIGMAAVRPAEFIILKFEHKLQES